MRVEVDPQDLDMLNEFSAQYDHPAILITTEIYKD